MKKIYFSLLVLFTCSLGYGQLSPGDISFVAFNADGDDDFAFVAFKDIPANTSIWFTDNEWTGTSFNNTNEGELEWSHTSIVTAGTIIIIEGSIPTSTIGTITGSGFNLGGSNEDILALLEEPSASTMSTPGFLAGISNDLSGSDTVLTGTGLTSGTNFIDFSNDSDGFEYNGLRSGESSFSNYLPLLMNTSNWQVESSNGDNIIPISTTAFTVSSGGGSCSITDLGITNLACNDNSTTSDATDDFITFDLDPTGSTLGSTYTISVNSGSVTPTSGTYGSATSFTLNDGSAGGGDVDVTITDDADNTCTATETINDPGSCSSGGGGTTTTIVEQDFDSNNTWSFSSNVTFFSHEGSNTLNNVYPLPDGWTDDGFFGEIDITNTNSVFSSTGLFSGKLLGTSDLDDEGDFGAPSATITFAQQNVSEYTNLEISFDYETVGLDSNDELEYIVIEDGTPGSTVALAKDNSGTEIVTISAINTVELEIIFTQNGGTDYIGIDNVTLNGTSTSTNDSDSDIVITNFDPTDNIDYTTYSTSSGLTTANAIKVGEFEIRDGGNTTDADAVGTILTDLDLDITNFDNLAAIALFDGSSNVSEVTTVDATTSFSSINSGNGLTAADDNTKTFDVYATFKSAVTDNEQLDFSISSATADGANGSIFSSADAGGASTTTTGDDNRIEVTASSLSFDQQPSDVEVSSVMSPSPTVLAVDSNDNTDLDYNSSVALSVSSSNFDASATTSVNATNGVATFSNLIFNATSTGSTLTASSGTLTDDTSQAFDVFNAPIVIALEDFDGTSPSWPNSSNIPFFGSTSSFDDFYGLIDESDASPLNNTNFVNNILGENDLENNNGGTSGFASTTFEEISIENFLNISLSFDWQVIGYNASTDDAKYEIFIDGVSQGETFLVDGGNDPQNGSGTVNFSVPANSSTLSLIVSIRNNGGSGYSGFDNFKLEGTYDGDLIYSAGTWSPNAPGTSSGTEDALVQDGTYSTSGDISLNTINVLGDATVEISSTDVLTINNGIINNGDFIFKSDANGTAQLADATGVTISGDVEVQRYIPAGPPNNTRAFRFLTSTVDSTVPIFDNWQESGNSPDGFGTHITGDDSGPAGGFNATTGIDYTSTGNPSMFTFDNTNSNGGGQNDDWEAITNTKSKNLIAGEAYRIFIRGDRDYILNSNPANPPNSDVTLRATGSLLTGSKTVSLSATQDFYSLIGNPYQAIVDMKMVMTNTNNVNTNYYWVWDPNVSTQGAYVAVQLSSGNTAVTSAANEYVMPGQSFFVQTATDATADLEFTEDSKSVGQPSTAVFSENTMPSINLKLFKTTDLNNQDIESDALQIDFSDQFSNAATMEDADKLGNSSENLARLNNGTDYLSIEKRELPTDGETLELFTNGYEVSDYTFVADLSNLPNGTQASLSDSYTGNTSLLNDGENEIQFTVDESIPGSFATDRFSLEFELETFGVDDNELAETFKVYPNPVTDDRVSIQSSNMRGKATVSLYNMVGQGVFKKQIIFKANGEINVDLGNPQSGVYFIEINQNGETAKERLIIN